MNAIRKLSTVLVLSSLALTAFPAGAVTPSSNWFANRYNAQGTTFTNMSPSDTHFCYLSKVGVDNAGAEGEAPTCRVTRGASVWKLEAILGPTGDADVEYSAYCYKN